jgi:CheY-like chemotaxis protein
MPSLPDVIFLDLNMPRLNGVDVLKKLKDSAQLKSVPVVIYSTSFDSRVREKCSSLGAIEIMEKPSCFDALCTRLQTLLHAL